MVQCKNLLSLYRSHSKKISRGCVWKQIYLKLALFSHRWMVKSIHFVQMETIYLSRKNPATQFNPWPRNKAGLSICCLKHEAGSQSLLTDQLIVFLTYCQSNLLHGILYLSNNEVIKHFEIPKTFKEIEIDVSATILFLSNGDFFCLTMYLPYKAGFIVYTSVGFTVQSYSEIS